MNKPRFLRPLHPRFTLDSSGNGAHSSISRDSEIEQLSGKCIALIDARFMGWLTGAEIESRQSISGTMVPTRALISQLHVLLASAGLASTLVRVYWYCEKLPIELVEHVVVRTVVNADQDAGFSLIRAMSEDLLHLANAHAIDQVLLASDDERLWPAVDYAQLGGLYIHMLCDDGIGNFPQLLHDDPTWARLLAQADRRLVWKNEVVSSTGQQVNEAAAPISLHAEEISLDPNQDHAMIQAYIENWWHEESEERREELRDELSQSRSIPQELDRQLLLRISRELGRPLSWPNKKAMREGLRRIALGHVADVVDNFSTFVS